MSYGLVLFFKFSLFLRFICSEETTVEASPGLRAMFSEAIHFNKNKKLPVCLPHIPLPTTLVFSPRDFNPLYSPWAVSFFFSQPSVGECFPWLCLSTTSLKLRLGACSTLSGSLGTVSLYHLLIISSHWLLYQPRSSCLKWIRWLEVNACFSGSSSPSILGNHVLPQSPMKLACISL